MTRFQRIASTASLFASVLLGYTAIAQAAPTAAATAEVGHARHGHRGHGRGDLVRASLRLPSLSTAQRQQIEALVAQEKSAHANVRVARGQLMQAVAAGVDSGNVDAKALEPKVQAVVGAIESDEPSARAALEKLHAILTPEQRAELVARVTSHGGHEHGDPAKGGQGQKGGEADHDGGEGRGPMGDLNLTPAQRQQIFANMNGARAPIDPALRAEARDSHKRVLEAFKGSRFVMSELAPPADPRIVEQGVARVVTMAKASAPVLTPEQRAIASAKLRQEAARATK